MDKNSKKLLNYLIAAGGCKKVIDFQEGLDSLAAKFNMDSEDLKALVRYLNSLGYLEYMYMRLSSGDKKARGFYLSHKGLNWKHFQREELIKYLKDKWIDFFAFLLSFAALIVSIIALTSNTPVQ